jgi:hypothetical protein
LSTVWFALLVLKGNLKDSSITEQKLGGDTAACIVKVVFVPSAAWKIFKQ